MKQNSSTNKLLCNRLWEMKRKHVKTLSNSTVTLIPKLFLFLASSTSKTSPGLEGDEEKALKFILLGSFSAEEDSLTKKNKNEFLVKIKINYQSKTNMCFLGKK